MSHPRMTICVSPGGGAPSFGELTWAALLSGAWLAGRGSISIYSKSSAGLGSGKCLFDMHNLNVIESTWHLDEDQTSGSVAARWKRDDI